eukprot:CAMPEP_0177661886 /NCGR_PEP_ID=MMETSP0447-20121125/18961_1 /TAXON_ID=0 /ORGANISM="Stygamoeba regulata, Strain BSH-02190019" /LENGTH=58 /DNA_ID=CAMNT_0019167345 /DNA_START=39 /DNA_END=211 /DNA_ORIENTATION=-
MRVCVKCRAKAILAMVRTTAAGMPALGKTVISKVTSTWAGAPAGVGGEGEGGGGGGGG